MSFKGIIVLKSFWKQLLFLSESWRQNDWISNLCSEWDSTVKVHKQIIIKIFPCNLCLDCSNKTISPICPWFRAIRKHPCTGFTIFQWWKWKRFSLSSRRWGDGDHRFTTNSTPSYWRRHKKEAGTGRSWCGGKETARNHRSTQKSKQFLI